MSIDGNNLEIDTVRFKNTREADSYVIQYVIYTDDGKHCIALENVKDKKKQCIIEIDFENMCVEWRFIDENF